MNRTKRKLSDIFEAFNRSEDEGADDYVDYKEHLAKCDEEYKRELIVGFDLTGLFVHNTSIAIH